MIKAVTVLVQGKVQGVGFRYSAREVALHLHIVGWVRNEPDGRVCAFAQGEPAAVDAFCTWLAKGPPSAQVIDITISPEKAISNVSDFRIDFPGHNSHLR